MDKTKNDSQSVHVKANKSQTDVSVGLRCFLIKSEDQSRFLNSFGAPVLEKQLEEYRFDYLERKELANKDIRSTNRTQSLYTKITVVGDSPEELEEGVKALEKARSKWNGRRRNPMFWEELSISHCTICYSTGHTRESCAHCGWCRKPGHFKAQCPEKPWEREGLLGSRKPRISLNESKKWKKEFLDDMDARPWWRQPGKVFYEWLLMMKPIGLENRKKPTLAVDTEGGGANVHVSGYVNGTFGIQTIYFDMLRIDTPVHQFQGYRNKM